MKSPQPEIISYDENGTTEWREGCEHCLRRTSLPNLVAERQSRISPPYLPGPEQLSYSNHYLCSPFMTTDNKISLDTSIDETDLPTLVKNSLMREQYRTIRHVLVAGSLRLEEIRNFGAISMINLRNYLNNYGYELTEYGEPDLLNAPPLWTALQPVVGPDANKAQILSIIAQWLSQHYSAHRPASALIREAAETCR